MSILVKDVFVTDLRSALVEIDHRAADIEIT
jgi:hypothetical protein